MKIAVRSALLCALVSVAQGQAAHAQEAELSTIPVAPTESAAVDSAATGEQPNDTVDLAEIIVTAQKRSQSLQKVPVSVGVIDGGTMAESGNFDAGALENFVPNVEIDIDAQAPVIGIRGYDTETDNVGFEPAVGLVLDDLALGRPEFIPDGMYDIDRVEVLRGPQGTLFGKNTIAGVITFRSVAPQDHFAAGLSLTGGDPDQKRAEAFVNLPLDDDAMRLAGVYWDRDGDVWNTAQERYENTQKQSAGRIQFALNPSDDWHIALSGQYSDTHVSYAPWQLDAASPNALAYAQTFDPETEDDPLNAQTSFDQPGFVNRTSDLERVLVEYDAGDIGGLRDVRFTTIVGHAGFDLTTLIDSDVSASDIIRTDFLVDYAQNSIEFRPSGTADSLFGLAGPVEWTLGLFAFQSEMESHLDAFAGNNMLDFALSAAGIEALGGPDIGPLGPILDGLPNLDVPINDALLRGFWQDTESYAAFGQMNWSLTDRLSAIIGARFGVEFKKADFDVERVGPGIVAVVIGAQPFETTRKRRETDFSPKLGLQYEWTPDVMTFATATRGFKGGGFNATASDDTNLEFEPEKATSFEVGLKSRLFDRRFTLNLTGYRTDIDNLQTVDFDGVAYKTANAAKARLTGIEIESLWRPAIGWFSLAAAVAFSKAEYVSYTTAPAADEDIDEENNGGPGDHDPDNDGKQDLSGRTLANAPRITGTLSPQLSFPLFAGLSGQIAVDVSYRGDQYSAVDLDSHSFQEAYTVLGARMSVTSGDGRWLFVVNGNNLTDKRTLDLVFDHSVFADTYVAQQNPLRSVSATLRYSFP
jgi:iron complex outermembrane receptor protein